MKQNSYSKLLFALVLTAVSIQTYGRGCWVYSSSSVKWFYFSSLCDQQFIINRGLGDMCYHVDNSCQALAGQPITENDASKLNPPLPSMSSLREVCDFNLSMDGSGNGAIYYQDKKVATLNPEGLSAFFSGKPCFYVSNEVAIKVIDGKVALRDNDEQIAEVKPGFSAGGVVELGKLNKEQVEMIRQIGTPAPLEIRQKYNLSVLPNPAGVDEVEIRFGSQASQKVELMLVNLYGSVVKQFPMDAVGGVNVYKMLLKGVIPGTYIVVLKTTDGFLSEKLIKQ